MNNLIIDIKNNDSELFKHYGFLSGTAGYILLLFNLKDYDRLYIVIEKTVQNLHKQNFSLLYSAGITGFLWVLNTVNKDSQITYLDDVIDTLNDILLSSIDDKILTNFDFLHGMTGIIHYLIDYGPRGKSEEVIKQYIKEINNKTIKEQNGYYLKFYQPRLKENLINFSLAHGISAIIQVLSRILKNKIEIKISKELLEGYISFMLNNQNNYEEVGSVFPSYLEKHEKKSRLAWCYGDLAAAVAIWQAGENTGNLDWKTEAENIFEKTRSRTTLDDGMVSEVMLCHGTSGIAIIYDRMWRNTKNKLFLDSRNHWLNETKKFAKYKDGVGGYKFNNSHSQEMELGINYGFLEGAIGLALTFLQINSKVDLHWDKALLISS